MEKLTLGETIREITRKHLEENNGLLFGQCLTAVGWINGTVPDCKNLVELPMTETAGAGFAVGAAIAGRRPILALRYQGFFPLNCNPVVQYAALSKELFGIGVPMVVRGIGCDSTGPAHSPVLHNIAMIFPGMNVCAPATPREYHDIWDSFMKNDEPYYISEHRRTYPNKEDWENIIEENADITLYGISDARIDMLEAVQILRKDGIKANVMHIVYLKPFDVDGMKKPLLSSKCGLVIDNGFPVCGAARSVAYELAESTGYFVHAMSCADSVKCYNPEMQNRTPDAAAICEKVRYILGR